MTIFELQKLKTVIFETFGHFYENLTFFEKKYQHRHFGLSFLENLTFYWEKSASPILSVIFDQLKNPAKNVRLRILKLVKPDICLKTDTINYVPLNPFFTFCWIEFWDMFFGVYLVPPRRPCLAAIMSNHHQFPISPAPPPTPPNQPSAKGLTKKGLEKKTLNFLMC